MSKEVVVKQNNPVAKFAQMFNRCKKMKSKKVAAKRGETKHKNKRSEDFSDLSSFQSISH